MERLALEIPQFTQAQVLQILPKLTGKTLQNWKSRGILDADLDAPGKGNRRLYTGHGIVMLSFMTTASEFGIPPSAAKQIAVQIAVCAQQLWDLRLEFVRPNGMHEIPVVGVNNNECFRRGFIYKRDYGYDLTVSRKDRKGSIVPRFYTVVGIDLININVLNLINRHLAGLAPVEFHVNQRLGDDDDAGVKTEHEFIINQIKTLPANDAEEFDAGEHNA